MRAIWPYNCYILISARKLPHMRWKETKETKINKFSKFHTFQVELQLIELFLNPKWPPKIQHGRQKYHLGKSVQWLLRKYYFSKCIYLFANHNHHHKPKWIMARLQANWKSPKMWFLYPWRDGYLFCTENACLAAYCCCLIITKLQGHTFTNCHKQWQGCCQAIVTKTPW